MLKICKNRRKFYYSVRWDQYMKKIPLYSKIIDELKERIRTGDFEYDVPFVTGIQCQPYYRNQST